MASPAYVATLGAPQTRADLAAHICLRISPVEAWNHWSFVGAGGKTHPPIKGNFEANSADAVYYAALAGVGVARLSTYLIGDALVDVRLVQILPEYADETSEIFAVYSNRRNLSPNVRAFIDFFAERFGPVPPCERDRAA